MFGPAQPLFEMGAVMNIRSIGVSAAIVASVLAISPTMAQDRGSSPLSQSFNRSPLSGNSGSTQAPSLWYYGPSYSLYYDRPPPGGTGPIYRPSHHYDPFYGPDYFDRYERGHLFGR
jgi:hypothetical protein